MMHSISPCHVFISVMSAYSFTMHHLASRLPSILHASCMVSYKDDLYKLLLVQVMAAPTIPISAKENLGDPIEIRVDVVHPVPVIVVAFPAATRWEEIEEELLTLRERENRAETEGITLRARVRSLEVVETWLHGIVKDEREARERIKCQLGLIQEELESLKRSRLP
ncbi:hypothetical protein Tco_1210135 [Tanacetum coccineum]